MIASTISMTHMTASRISTGANRESRCGRSTVVFRCATGGFAARPERGDPESVESGPKRRRDSSAEKRGEWSELMLQL